MSEPECDVFLCHNGADKPWVETLGARLEAETIDGNAGSGKIKVFLDKWDIEGGENVVKRLGHALNSSRLVAVVMSPGSEAAETMNLLWVVENPSQPKPPSDHSRGRPLSAAK
jgi:hypothetical protein